MTEHTHMFYYSSFGGHSTVQYNRIRSCIVDSDEHSRVMYDNGKIMNDYRRNVKLINVPYIYFYQRVFKYVSENILFHVYVFANGYLSCDLNSKVDNNKKLHILSMIFFKNPRDKFNV